MEPESNFWDCLSVKCAKCICKEKRYCNYSSYYNYSGSRKPTSSTRDKIREASQNTKLCLTNTHVQGPERRGTFFRDLRGKNNKYQIIKFLDSLGISSYKTECKKHCSYAGGLQVGLLIRMYVSYVLALVCAWVCVWWTFEMMLVIYI